MNTPPASRVRRIPASPTSPSPRSPKKRKVVESPSSSNGSPKIKLHFSGRVYRTPDASLSPKKLKYAPGAELLGAPDELTVDAAYEAVPVPVQLSSLLASPTLRPATKTASRTLQIPELNDKHSSFSDSDLEVEPPSAVFRTPTKTPTHSRVSSSIYNLHPSTVPLPESYQLLLSLHTAFERALMLHLTTEGKGGRIASAVAETSSQASQKIRLENLATYSQLKSMVERGSGRRFGQKEFAKLVWLWNEGGVKEEEASTDPFLESTSSTSSLGFLVTKTVELSKTNGKRVNGWGIGIELDLKRNEEASERSLSIHNSPVSASKKSSTPNKMVGKREGMSVVALWSQGAEYRKNEIRQRLGRCVIQHHEAFLMSFANTINDRPSTPSSQSRKGKQIEKQPSFHASFDFCSIPDVPSASLPDLQNQRADAITLNSLSSGSSSPVKSEEDSMPTLPQKKPTAKARVSSLMERIKAKEEAQNSGIAADGSELVRMPKLALLSPTRKSLKTNSAAAERERTRMAAFKRKSMLSRMPNVADALYMLFAPTAPPSPSSSLPTPPTRHRRAVPIDEVCVNIAKSSKISLSSGEAKEAIALLIELCPTFVTMKKVEGKDWVMLGSGSSRGSSNLKECKDELKRVLVEAM